MKKNTGIDEVNYSESSDDYTSKADQVWVVAHGVEVTSKRGILKPGDAVKAAYFKHGQSVLDDLVKNGSVVKK
jgi:hypothetical protein